MVVKIDNKELIQELKNRYIGYETSEGYYVDDYQATYLYQLGKIKKLEKSMENDPIYKIFKHLRKNMHVVNVTPEKYLLVYERGMIPKHSVSKYMVVLINDDTDFKKIMEYFVDAKKARKTLVLTKVKGENIFFYKISDSKLK